MKIRSVKLGKKTIGEGFGCYIIAEIGSNFDGKLSKAKRLVKLAKESGADAAKFQSFITEKIISKSGFENKSSFQSKWKKSVWNVYKDAELPILWHKELSHYAKKIGIDFFSAPYNYDAVDLLVKLNVPVIKIGSGEITNLEFLKYVGKTKKPILLATGASTINEITEAINAIKATGNNKIILMQSTTQYPSPINQANVKTVLTLREKFRLNVGYSDLTLGDLVILCATSMGERVVEKHFTINSRDKGPDHSHSMNPEEFRNMVNKIRLLDAAIGDGMKKIEKCEKTTRIIQRRGIWTINKIKKGDKFSKKNIDCLRPVSGLSANKFSYVLGKKAKKNHKPFHPLTKNDL